MFTLEANAKDWFFDSTKVLERTTKAERSVLIRQGAFLRRRVRTDILRRTKKYGTRRLERDKKGRFKRGSRVNARPGQPPIIHSRDPNASLKKILFAYDANNRSVVVGPAGLDRRLRGSNRGTIPELLEKGGTSSVEQWAYPNSDVWNFGHAIGNSKSRTIRAKYASHPFMGPGLEKEIQAGTFTAPWAGAVK